MRQLGLFCTVGSNNASFNSRNSSCWRDHILVPQRKRLPGRFLPGLGARHTSCCSLGQGSIRCPPLRTHSDHPSKTGTSPHDARSPKQHKQQKPDASLQILNTISLIITRIQIREIYRVFFDTRCETRGRDSSSILYIFWSFRGVVIMENLLLLGSPVR